MNKKIAKIILISFSLVLIGGGCNIFGSDERVKTAGPAGMFVTTDKGETWQQISTLLTSDGLKKLSDTSVYRIFEDPQDPDALYWASRGKGLYYSYDKGQSWQQVKGPLSNGFIYSVAVHPKDKCLIYASSGLNVYKSEDCTRSWEKVYQEDRANAKVFSLEFRKSPPYQLYMGKENGDFLVSKDARSSWTVLNRFNGKINRIIASRQKKDRIYIASSNLGLRVSNDGAQSWTDLTQNMEEFSGAENYRRIWINPKKAGNIYWASDYGILVSNDAGNSWKALELITSPGSANIWALAVNPNNTNQIYYTATIGNRSTFYYSIDGGNSWTTKELPTGRIPTMLKVHSKENDVIYTGFSIPPNN